MGNVGNYIYSGQLQSVHGLCIYQVDHKYDNALGWTLDAGFIPLVKTAMTILAGFTLTKKGLFPPAASRGASHLSMVRLPPICIHMISHSEF
jgi:hypothetical protein